MSISIPEIPEKNAKISNIGALLDIYKKGKSNEK